LAPFASPTARDPPGGQPEAIGDPAVRPGRAVGDLPQLRPTPELELAALRRERQVELAAPVGEVLAELVGGRGQHRQRGVPPALGAAALQQLVVRAERDAGQRLAVRGEQQVAHRTGQHHPPRSGVAVCVTGPEFSPEPNTCSDEAARNGPTAPGAATSP
jgi:hypothetical protein